MAPMAAPPHPVALHAPAGALLEKLSLCVSNFIGKLSILLLPKVLQESTNNLSCVRATQADRVEIKSFPSYLVEADAVDLLPPVIGRTYNAGTYQTNLVKLFASQS